jgi:hypothetical protein
VFSTFAIEVKPFTNVLNSPLSLNFAITMVSVVPVISYTPQTFSNFDISFSISTILSFFAMISIMAVNEYPIFS